MRGVARHTGKQCKLNQVIITVTTTRRKVTVESEFKVYMAKYIHDVDANADSGTI